MPDTALEAARYSGGTPWTMFAVFGFCLAVILLTGLTYSLWRRWFPEAAHRADVKDARKQLARLERDVQDGKNRVARLIKLAEEPPEGGT